MGGAGRHAGNHRAAARGATLKNVFEEHPKTATVGAVIIAVAVVLLLWFLSTRAPSAGSSSTQPVFAHGNSGPVATRPGGSSGADTTASETASGQSIGDVDFAALLAAQITGGRTLESVIYLDIDGNGDEEAVAAIRGTGDSRPLSWRLYGMKAAQVEILYERTDVAQGEIRVDGPRLAESEGVFAEGDQPCCPSSLKRTFYVWKGSSLVVSHVESAPPGA